MSHILGKYDSQKKNWALKLLTEFLHQYIKQQTTHNHEFLFCVVIPWPLLKIWNELLDRISNVKYIDLLNSTVVDRWFAIKPNCVQIEGPLPKKAASVRQVYRKTQGRKCKALDSNVYKLSVRRAETDLVEDLNSEVQKYQNKIDEWKKKC